ncbi:MAG: alpha/beta hydrolase [Chloroflexi bacterium]|nr:alpha/beta hydrolase [Chloroflexota bacterium]
MTTPTTFPSTETLAPMDGFYLTRDGLRIHYLDWGNPNAMPLVLIHGLRAYAHTWDLVAQELRNDFHVIAVDVRGRGDSDWDPNHNYFTATYCMDVEDLVSYLEIKKLAIIGHSMGGATAILYAGRYPDRLSAAVIVDAGPAAEPPTPGIVRIGNELSTTPATFRSWDDAANFLRAQRPTASEESMRIRLRASLKQLPDGAVTWKYDLRGLQEARGNPAGRIDLWPYLRAIKCPTLIVRGARSDVFLPPMAQRMVATMASARLVEVSNAGHPVWDDNLAGFNREVKAFLSRLL